MNLGQRLKRAVPVFASGCLLLLVLGISLSHRAAAFEPYSYNEVRRVNSNGTVTSMFHGKFINYLNEDNEWENINLSFERTDQGFHLTTAPYELHIGPMSTDTMRFVSTNKYDVHNDRIREDPPLGKDRRFTQIAPVEGKLTNEGVLYENAFAHFNAHLLLQPHEMEARYLVTWDSKPGCNGVMEISFEETFDAGEPRMRDGRVIPAQETELAGGFYVSTNEFRGIGMPKARIWDSSGKARDISVTGKYENGIFTGKKIVPCDFFEGVTYPVYTDDTNTFYPDGNPEVSSVDGMVTTLSYDTASQAVWDAVHDAAQGSYAYDSHVDNVLEIARTGLVGGSAGYVISRGFLLFDTSSLTGRKATDATVSVYVPSKNNGDNDGDDFIVFVKPASPASNTALVVEDFDQCGAVNSPTEISSRIDIGSINTSAYNDFDITDTSVISTSGISKFCVREGHDVLDTPYSGSTGTWNDIYIAFAESSGTSVDPKLVVTHVPTSDLSIQKTGDLQVGSGATAIYTLTVTNNGPAAATGILVSDLIPSGFIFRGAESSSDCSVAGAYVTCGSFQLANGTSTGRIIAFDVQVGTCDIQRTNTASVSGATVYDSNLANNSSSLVTSVACPVPSTYVRKSADENVASSTTLQNDDHLVLALEAGKTYAVNGVAFATSTHSQPDIKVGFSIPTGATMDIGFLSGFGTQFSRAALLETSGVASPGVPIGSNQHTILLFMGTVVVGSNAGNLTLQWAQDTSNSNPVVLKQGSYISIVEVE